ncbi:MAG TPA: alpha-amylase family glycosyl hydrolase, partial [Pyrinomonadaceae bacterium]
MKSIHRLHKLFLVLAFVSSVSAQTITKVDPPSWWANLTTNPVRLLVRGTNLSGASVSSSNAALRVSKVSVNEKGTYLFADVDISESTRPGDYQLDVATPNGRTTIPFRIDAPLNTFTNFQGINADDIIYLIMIDRFADGDTSTNAPANSPAEANDRNNPRAYHGGDLRGIINQLPYLKDLGVTALWLTPWYDNWNGLNRCNRPWCPNTYYHGYHTIDYYGVEDHFGDMAT